ncbi:MAG: cellulase family glycosylhydrolase [Roseiflexaceae bacterium]
MRLRLLILIVLVSILISCSSPAVLTTTPEPTVVRADCGMPTNTLQHGINVFMLGADTKRILKLTTSAHFGWVRQQIHWRDIEGVRGQFVWEPLDQVVDQSRANRLHILLSVVRSPDWAGEGGGLPDSAQFEAFMRVLATRYQGRVAAYQIWNEPNMALENGGRPATAPEYLRTLMAGYAGVKAGDPCALVVSAAPAANAGSNAAVVTSDLDFFRELYQIENRAFLRYADVVAIHPGGGPFSPMDRWAIDRPDQSEGYFRHIDRVRAIMLAAEDRRPAWITEVGWNVLPAAGAPTPVDERQQAEYLIGALRLIRSDYPWITHVFVWNLNFAVLGQAGDEKNGFGILKPSWAPRPAYLALQGYLNAVRLEQQSP